MMWPFTKRRIVTECRDYLDHDVVWGGDGYYCWKCMRRFVPDERQTMPAKEVDTATLKKVLGTPLREDPPLIVPKGCVLAKGGVVREATTLHDKLIANRMAQKKGHGTAYWDSVVRVVEEHYQKKAD